MSRSPLARVALITSLVTVTATGCSAAVDPARVLVGALVPFSACDDAVDYFTSHAVDLVGPYGLDGAGGSLGGLEDRVVTPEATGAVPGPAPGGDAAAGAPVTDFSGTNVQEAGVDEPDIVKTDGRLIVTVVDGVLRVVDAASGEQVGRLDLARPSDTGGTAPSPVEVSVDAELLLAGDRALVLVRGSMAMYDAPRAMPGWNPWQTSRLLSVDLSDPARPTVVASLDLDGDIVSARLVDGVVRVAVRTEPALEFPYAEDLEGDEAAMTARNRALIEGSELTDWLPSAVWRADGETSEDLLVPCDRLSYPEEFAGFSTVSVLSLAIDGDLRETAGTGVVGSGDTVYASADRFYVVTNGWTTAINPSVTTGSAVQNGAILGDVAVAAMPPGGGRLVAPIRDQWTGIHAFDISSSGPAQYIGSGQVMGHLIGQYALSEWEGNLRVASTTNGDWSSNGPASDSRVTVLGEQDGALVDIGMVDGLGEGEQIYAVRYVGPTAYVVTFRQTDPLYVLDLADPTEPVVRGELKVTGYSAYLHPVGDGRVVGVGQQARRNGTQVGAQVSLFDVSDPTEPGKLDGHVVRNGWAEAEYDERSFLFWAPTGEVVIPMSDGSRSGALVLAVEGDSLAEVGWITSGNSGAAASGQAVRRALVIGDTLFTVWPDGIQSSDLETLTELTWVDFA